MSVRLLFRKIWVQKAICHMPSKRHFVTASKFYCIKLEESEKDTLISRKKDEEYFRALFYDTHPSQVESLEDELAGNKISTKTKEEDINLHSEINITSKEEDITLHSDLNITSKLHSHSDPATVGLNNPGNSELNSQLHQATIATNNSENISTASQNSPFPEDVIATKLDADVLDSIGPPLPKAFNLASFADKSETIQQFINLGVDLFRVEKCGYGQYILDLDFEKNVKQHLLFFNDVGVTAEDLGLFITRNPDIFEEDIADLRVRIDYLKSKKLANHAITRIITKAPEWLSYSTKDIDSRLGVLQKLFSLSGNEVRFLVTKKPKIAIANFKRLRESNFAIREEMGFTEEEAKKLLLAKPKIWLLNKQNLLQRFDYIHNHLKIPHNLILLQPDALLQRKFKIEQRHLYLEKLGRVQYDPTKPGYVSLGTLAFESEENFCEDICKTCVEDFNKFLKTL